MYGINENTKETNVASPINPGIQDNIHLVGVKFEPLKEGGDPVLQVEFADEYGSQLREILWEVDEERERRLAEEYPKEHKRDDQKHGFIKGTPVTGEDRIAQAYELFSQRAKHIGARFIDEKTMVEATSDAQSYQEFGEAYANLFTESRIKGVRVRLKVVLNNSDYSTLPNYPPFIESMDVPKEKSRLSLGKYDRVTPQTAQNGADDGSNWEETTELEDDPVF